jgi:hypothetical protein
MRHMPRPPIWICPQLTCLDQRVDLVRSNVQFFGCLGGSQEAVLRWYIGHGFILCAGISCLL